jgi:crotonobetainyl-CoA:carnitine CoA-transferase CaiB-like acyl-CoA transferase
MVERLGDVPLIASPLRLSSTPPEIRLPPPRLGEHTAEVLELIKPAPSQPSPGRGREDKS